MLKNIRQQIRESVLSGRKFLAEKLHPQDPAPEIINTTSIITTERLAGFTVGQAFGIATRDGIKVFKLIEIREYKKKEGGDSAK